MINKNDSFTLIEILVVIVIIGILSSFIFVGMNSITGSANTAKAQAWANSLKNAGLLNIVSEYKFQGTTANGAAAQAGDVLDSWGTNHGIIAVTPPNVQTTSCALGRCLNFVGGADFVRIADSATLVMGTQMSAFIWVKGEPTGNTDKGLFAHYDETTANRRSWAIATSTSTSGLRINVSGDGDLDPFKSYVSAESILDNKWHYVGFTYTGNTLNIFIDGLNVTSGASKTDTGTMTTLHDSASSASIGSFTNGDALAKGFTGQLDDAIIFKAVISTSEIERQYFSGLNALLAKGEITNSEYNERISLLSNSFGSK